MIADVADLVLTNARILTMDPERPVAQAVAVSGGLITGVGLADEVGELVNAGATRVVDLEQRLLVPGFNDCHMHLLPYGLDLAKADLSHAAGVTDVPSLVAALQRWSEQNPQSEWVQGSRYDQNTFPGATHPTRHDLDHAFPDRPVYLTQTSKHAASCNSVALKLAGVTRETADPPGGEIVRGASGEPTGVLLESAMNLVADAIPQRSQSDLVAAIRRANEELMKAGVTSASDLNVGWIDPSLEIRAYLQAATEGAPIRTTLFPHAPAIGRPECLPARHDFAMEHGLEDPLASPAVQSKIRDSKLSLSAANGSKIRLGPIKLFSDGALTVRTAALREPYVDGSGLGMLLHPPGELKTYIVEADRKGWQVAVHAIGDRAVELVLDCYAACDGRARRHRIEHAMLLDYGLIRRFAEQQVIPVVQPEFIARLGDAYVLGLGQERAARLNPTASLQRAGVGVPFSSDCPIVPGAPLDGIRAAARRTTRTGTVLGPEERISPIDGLRNYTEWAAYSTFDEANVGRIAAGMRADFAVLDCEMALVNGELRDEHLESLTVAGTIVGGERVYGEV